MVMICNLMVLMDGAKAFSTIINGKIHRMGPLAQFAVNQIGVRLVAMAVLFIAAAKTTDISSTDTRRILARRFSRKVMVERDRAIQLGKRDLQTSRDSPDGCL